MNRLERDFSAQVDFFLLDIDVPDSREYLDRYAIRSRSTYVLLSGTGEEVLRWTGPLSDDVVATELAGYLETLE